MNLSQDDRRKLAHLLDDLPGAVEELLLTGLTTASQSTRQKLDVAFREASRMRLLRLGSALRVANEELGRYVRHDDQFSQRRLVLFLTQAWLLSHGLARALRENDEGQIDRLLWTPAGQPLERIEVVTLGVVKRVVQRAFCAFEFRLRSVSAASGIPPGTALVWSSVFPVKPEVDIPAEGFLHLPQKQKFKAREFLDGKVITIENAAVALDAYGSGRISLLDQSRVTAGEPFGEWGQFLQWDPAAACARLEAYSPSPLDLEIELQEEVVLRDWEVGQREKSQQDGECVYPIRSGPIEMEAPVGPGKEMAPVGKYLGQARRQQGQPPLFGLMHYRMCRFVLQPLSVFGGKGPEYITICDENIDRKALLQALKF